MGDKNTLLGLATVSRKTNVSHIRSIVQEPEHAKIPLTAIVSGSEKLSFKFFRDETLPLIMAKN